MNNPSHVKSIHFLLYAHFFLKFSKGTVLSSTRRLHFLQHLNEFSEILGKIKLFCGPYKPLKRPTQIEMIRQISKNLGSDNELMEELV